MPRKPVRRKDADNFVLDETDDFRTAVCSGKTDVVKDMLAAVSKEDAQTWACGALDDADGRTALHHAISAPEQEQIQMIRLLGAQRADPNAAGPDGVTPLHLAAQRGSKFVIRTLLCARADNQKQAADGRTAVDFAKYNPSPVEAFEVVGWPGTGPELKPLEPKKAPGKSASGSGGAAEGTGQGPLMAYEAFEEKNGYKAVSEEPAPPWSSLTWPLLAAAIWFGLLSMVVAHVIRYV
ncbi:unnamed protein product [Polarella glacialis]|uniref:Uncharacterized protein n=1 Tax=Polarella glacialis TaxID=89957 RepID=A0A813HPX8_POLGL|nr:unnamed protein product [Polarella glacialis]